MGSGSQSSSGRRPYESPARRRQTEETRDRILAAASGLVIGSPSREWRGLTFRAVAQLTGLSERTVYRYFSTEQDLRDAVISHLEVEAGDADKDLQLEHLGDAARRSVASLAMLLPAPAVALPYDGQRHRQALLEAVAGATGDWSDRDQQMAAAILDVLAGIPTYERLVASWHLDPADAGQAVKWATDAVTDAIRRGRRPNASTKRESPGPNIRTPG